MNGFVIFALTAFLIYLQSGIYVFWSYPTLGINHWFSLLSVFLALWLLAYVFSGMGDSVLWLFSPGLITLAGMLLIPAFYFRLYASFTSRPKKLFVRNLVFSCCLLTGMVILIWEISNPLIMPAIENQLEPSGMAMLYILHAMLLIGHATIFSKLHLSIPRTSHMSKTILDKSPQLILLCDPDFRIVYANEFALRIFPEYGKALMGRNIWSVFEMGEEMGKKYSTDNNQQSDMQIHIHIEKTDNLCMSVDVVMSVIKDFYRDIKGYILTGSLSDDTPTPLEQISQYKQDEIRLMKSISKAKAGIKNELVELATIRVALSEKLTKERQFDEMLIADINEREILIGEIHDRVVSNMQMMISLIKMHRTTADPTAFNQYLNTLSQRVHAILLAHQNMYFSIHYSDVDVKSLINSLVTDLSGTYDPAGQVGLHLDIQEGFLNIEQAIPLGLIMNELISNCYVHAFGSDGMEEPLNERRLINIYCHKQAGEWTVKVKDNGCGNPDISAYTEVFSGGLALVRMLALEQVNGSMQLLNDQGIEAEIHIPVI